MISKAYESVISEHFDILDDNTRYSLLNINEADQNKVLESLTSKLYKSIMDKVDHIDFGSISNSKGDITQIENYDNIIECIKVIKDILIEYRQDLEPIDTILFAIDNIKSRTDIWRRAFSLRLDLPVLIYNTIVLSIVSSVSLLIATSIEFIKDATDSPYSVKFDKVAYVRNKDGLLFDNLRKFNSSCKSGEMDRCLDHIFKSGARQLAGMDVLTIVSIVGVVGIVTNIVPIIRELVFFFYNTKQSISDYFDIQADLLQMNSEYVKHNPNIKLSGPEKTEVVTKQNKIVAVFRNLANKLAIDNKYTEAKTQKDVSNSKKKYKIEDVVDSKLDSLEEPGKSSIF